MPEELKIAPGTTLTVVSRSEGELELRARYEAGGSPPPAHLHPAQDEHFEIVEGAIVAVVADREVEVRAGETLEVPRGTAHKMWNAGEEPAVTRWITRPAGRTLDWVREIAAVQSGEPLGDPATLLERYADVFGLVAE